MKRTLLMLLLSAATALAEPRTKLVEAVRDYALPITEGIKVRLERGQTYEAKLYSNAAEVKIDGVWFTVPRSVVRAVRDDGLSLE